MKENSLSRSLSLGCSPSAAGAGPWDITSTRAKYLYFWLKGYLLCESYLTTQSTHSQSMNSTARRMSLSWLFAFSSTTKTSLKVGQDIKIIFLCLAYGGHNNAHSVMMPSVPSLPINNYFRSYPVLSFLKVVILSRISPLGSTAFRPIQLACRLLCLIKLMPPAFVAKLPPIWQLPFAPRSIGKSYLRSAE